MCGLFAFPACVGVVVLVVVARLARVALWGLILSFLV